MKKIKYLLPLIFIFILIPINAKAISYEYVTRDTFPYDINNYYIDNGYIVINGWGITATDQQLTGSDTHEYSLTLTNRKTSKVNTYVAELKSVNKTELMRMKTTYRACGYYELNASPYSCYYNYSMVGFEFRIPLSDLDADTEYDIMLRIWAKIVNKGYQLQIYAPLINKYYEVNGVRYLLNSDMSKTYATITGEPVFVRNGASVGSSVQTGWQWCSSTYKYTLYWWLYHTYYNIRQVVQTNAGAIDSETWLNIGFNQGTCSGSRSRASNGTNYSGWIAAIYADYSGTPATIKTYKVKNTSIDKIKTYTVISNTSTKVIVNLYNNTTQTNNVKAYHNGNLVYNQNITYSGSKELTINYNIPSSGTVRIVITEPNGLTTELSSAIYISSEKNYTLTQQSSTIVDTTPVIVSTSKDGTVNKYYEHITVSVPSLYNKITAGKGFENWTSITYYSDSSEIKLNKDISSYVYYDSQDSGLSYTLENNKVKVSLEELIENDNNDYFSIEQFTFNKLTGQIYKSSNVQKNITTTNGGRKWYVAIDKDIGIYDYEYSLVNVGVNKIKIVIPCKYEINKTLFGNIDSEYFIKRVNIPLSLNTIFSKTYTPLELYGGN
ncbi:MAG: hypothetical protein PHX40_00060 [Bacilli bacterium]|nr:hypothetical protein [Bacilli bacterium]